MCKKHINTKLDKYKLSKIEYNNWTVIYVIGDLSIENNYILQNNMLYIKYEDTYIHLLKKLLLSLKYLYEIFI